MSICGSLPTAPASLRLSDLFSPQLSGCPAPSDPFTSAKVADGLCLHASNLLNGLPPLIPLRGDSLLAAQQVADACDACAGAEARAEHVISTDFLAFERVACCNTLSPEGEIQCTLAGSAVLLLVPVVILIIALAISLLRISSSSKQMLRKGRFWWRKKGMRAVDVEPHFDGGVAGAKQFEDDVRRAHTLGQQETQAALARRLLAFCDSPLADERAKLMDAWTNRIGFQADNAANQLEHLSSLLVSEGASNGGDYERAIDSVHAKVIGPVERWRAHVGLGDRSGVVTHPARRKTPMARVYGGIDGSHTVERRNQGLTYASLATSSGPLAGFVRLSPSQQLAEICLFLLIWGEAANLRFMPELLHTIFELARSHVVDHTARGRATLGTEKSFLRQVVRPIYNTIVEARTAKARTGHSYDTENYDDWNEAFWRRKGGLDDMYTEDGICIFAQPPPDRWACLLRADWGRFLLAKSRKTHREMRWWTCLLAANRRIFLLHFVTFALVLIWSMSALYPSEIGNWGISTLVTLFWLFAPASAVFGRSFERWARNTVQSRARLTVAYVQMLIVASLCGAVLGLTASYSFSDFANMTLGDTEWNAIVFVATGLLFMGLLTLYTELTKPTPPEADALDARPFYERRLADIYHLRTPWFQRDRRTGAISMTPDVRDMLTLNTFWLLVWGLKIFAARVILLPILLDTHAQLVNAMPLSAFNAIYEESLASQVVLRLQPRMLLRVALQVVLWGTGGAIYLADTLGWYHLVLSLWGGIDGLNRFGVARTRERHVFGLDCYATLRRNAYAKLLMTLAPNGEAARKLKVAAIKDSAREPVVAPPRVTEAWKKIWHSLVDDLYGRCLLSATERDALRNEKPVRIQSQECVRRLRFFMRTLASSDIPTSHGALQAAGISVLVPVYSEPILPQVPADMQRDCGVPRGRDSEHSVVLDRKTLDFLLSDFDVEWKRLQLRLGDRALFRTPFDRLMRVRTWAAERLQTVYRTVAGMMKHRKALDLLLAVELPTLSIEERRALLNLKFRLVVAVQTYANHHPDANKSNAMDNYSREDVKLLLERYKHGLAISYIQRVGDCFYSCIIDGTRRSAAGELEIDPDHPELLSPTYRIELPGFPVLGNGKSDNQNMAIPYTRGTLIQAIDCNQEGYLEESLKIANVLREFDIPIPGGAPPAIVGFREHIFSDLGTLGSFAATAELVFGTLVQRTLSRPLWSRYHYGHPDVMNKLVLIAQGGLSKATKGLNLSEDIFAGMDAQLRGHNIVHREYFQVGKGRDMGAISILQFFSKLSQGTAQMSTSRQALRLGQRLSIGRLLGFYYTHIGYYAGQLHYYHASYLLLALAFVGSLADATGALVGAGPASAAPFNGLFGLVSILFFLFNLLPSFLAYLTDEGVIAACRKPLGALLTFSPFFFVMQSRCIAHYFSLEFAVGGGKYIPTGRGLAINHTPFHEIFATYAASCMYPGVELLLLLSGLITLAPICGYALNYWALGFASIAPVSLILGPSLFNPHAFCIAEGVDDLGRFVRWLVRPAKAGGGGFDPRHSWADFHQERADAKRAVRYRAFLLPSKELLISMPLLLTTYVVMAPHGWGIVQLILLGAPVVSAVAIFLFAMPSVILYAALWHKCNLAPAMGEASQNGRLELVAVLLVAIALVLECIHWEPIDELGFATMPTGLDYEQWLLLAATRYFSFRWTCNTGLYLASGLDKRAVEKPCELKAEPAVFSACMMLLPNSVVYVAALTGAAFLFLVDALLGLTIHVIFLLASLVPGIKRGHYAILGFSQKVRATSEKQRSTVSTLAWLAGKADAERARAAARLAAEREAELAAQQAAAEEGSTPARTMRAVHQI